MFTCKEKYLKQKSFFFYKTKNIMLVSKTENQAIVCCLHTGEESNIQKKIISLQNVNRNFLIFDDDLNALQLFLYTSKNARSRHTIYISHNIHVFVLDSTSCVSRSKLYPIFFFISLNYISPSYVKVSGILQIKPIQRSSSNKYEPLLCWVAPFSRKL